MNPRAQKYGWILIALIIFLSGCSAKETAKAQAPSVIPVKVSKVAPRDIFFTLEYVGNIKARDEVLIYPKVSGKIAEKVKEDGVSVMKGDALLYIDRDEVGLKYEKAPVESPIVGTVGRIYVDIGAHVLPQTAVALVVNMDTVKIDLDIPEKHLPRITLGQEAKISSDAYPGKEFIGKVTKISPVLDLATRSAPVVIEIDNPDHSLKSGMFAKVSLIIEAHKNVPVVLKESILGREPEQYVYIIENGRARSRKIVTGIRQGAMFEVNDGLKAGELVVVMGQQRLYDNAVVRVEEENLSEGAME